VTYPGVAIGLGAGQCKPSLKGLINKIIEQRFAIVGDHAKLPLRTRRAFRRHADLRSPIMRLNAL